MTQFCYLAFVQNDWNWKTRSASGIPSLLNQVPHFRHIIHALYSEKQNRDLFSLVFKAYTLTSSGEKELDLEPKMGSIAHGLFCEYFKVDIFIYMYMYYICR